MPGPRIPRALPTWIHRERPDMSESHKALIKRLPCLVCGAPAIEGHHLMRTGDNFNAKGTSRTSSDRWLLPTCRPHHNQAHDAGDDEAWFAEQGIDARSVARSLWAATGDLDAMNRIVFRASQTRRSACQRTY